MLIHRPLMLAAMLSRILFGCDSFQSDNHVEKKLEAIEKVKELSPKEKLEFAEKCSKAGQVYFDSYIASNLPDDFLYDEPEYHYSARMNTCLVHIRFVYSSAGDFSIHSNQIIDVFANKVILQGHFTRDNKQQTEKLTDVFNDATNFTSTEYFKQKDALFSN